MSEGELWEGRVLCGSCGSEYSVSRGVVDLMGDASGVVSSEIEAYRRSGDEVHAKVDSLSDVHRREELLKIALMEHTGEQFKQTSDLNLEGILSVVDPTPGQWLLELGAGSGWLTSRWAKQGLNCLATDISMDLKLELSPLVMSTQGVYFDRALADMNRLPFGNETFDIVFVSAALHHSEDLVLSLNETARVLKGNGKLVVINEPMHGILRKGGKRFIDQAALDNPGINEQSFNYFQWRGALRSASLNATYRFPDHYRAVLESASNVESASPGLATIAKWIWRSPIQKLLLVPKTITAVQILLGVNVCLVATKLSREV